MTAGPLVTIVRGRAPEPRGAAGTAGELECYRTDDDQILLVLYGDRPEAAPDFATSVEVCHRWDAIAAVAGGSTSEQDGFQAWITLTTTFDRQRALADVNTDETRSTLRHLAGFRSVTFFLGRDHPTVSEHVVWESEAHYAAATHRPEFASRHLDQIAELAGETSWQRLWPCARVHDPS